MNGILILNKSKGITSQGAVSKVKKILKVNKCGHTGTLDPLATGVLPILIGSYTKLSKYLMEHDKTYIATIKLGEKSSTGDEEGEIITKKPIPDELDEDKIKLALKNFLGPQKQIPPMYSAIKINGKKLYEYARKGEAIEVPKRDIEIFYIKLIFFDNKENIIRFEVKCSKGTYIRTLCEDISESIGTVGYMKDLVRIQVDKFSLDKSFSLEDVESGKYELITMDELFHEYPKLDLNSRKLELFLNGVNLTFNLDDGIYNVYSENKYVGLGIVKNKLLKRDVIVGG